VYGPEILRPVPFPRHALHALRLVFRHPVDERTVEVVAPPPADFTDLVARLRGQGRGQTRGQTPG
jgi:hypothetical protein